MNRSKQSAAYALAAYALVAMVILSGCTTQQGLVNGTVRGTPKYDESSSFFIGGFLQTDEIDAAKICGGANKVAAVQTHHSFENIVLTVLTGSLYSPRVAQVYCKR